MGAHGTLDGDGRADGGWWLLEGREELIAGGVDFATAMVSQGFAQQPPQLAQHGAVRLSEAVQQFRRFLDVDQRERDPTFGQPLFWPELRANESERHDAELLRRLQEAHPRSVAVHLVLEVDATEPGERVTHVRLIVDG
jgi:hypothetical protein